MIKKLLTVILSITVLLSCIVIPQATVLADAEEFHKYDAIAGLGFMDFYSSGNFEINNSVSRAEFAEILCKFANVDVESGEPAFSDVDEKTVHRDYIYTAVKYKLMKGTGNGLFDPNEFVTVNQVVKTMVVLLGYEKRAAEMGGYPIGYYTCAAENGLLAGVESSTGDGEITREDLACILYNTMGTEILEVTVMTGSGSYKYQDGQKMLKAYHGIMDGEGIVEGNDRTMIDSVSGTPSVNRVIIGGAEYLIGNTEASELLGLNVKYYYSEAESGDKTLVWLMQKNNNIDVLNAEDLNESRSTFTTMYYYDENDEERYINMETDLKVIYNGVYFFECKKEDLFPNCGDVTLIDNDGDNKAEIILVNDYSLLLVSHVNDVAASVTDKQGTGTLNLEDYEYIYFKKGDFDAVRTVEETASAIAANDVLLVAKSKDAKTYIKILASSESIRESILGINEDGEYYSGKKSYKINPYASGLNSKIKIGTTYTLRLDALGNIAEVISNVKDYAYLVGAKNSASTLDKKLTFKLYTTAGEFETFDCAEKVQITAGGVSNRYTQDEYDTAYNLFLDSNKKVVNQLLTFKLNDDSKITEIELARTAIGENGADDFTLNYEAAEAGKTYDGVVLGNDDVIPQAGNAQYSVLDSVMFSVPAATDSASVNNVNLYRYSKNTSDLALGVKYNLKLYDADENNNIPVVLHTTASLTTSFTNAEHTLLVINSLNEALDSNGNVITVVDGYMAGKRVSYPITSDQAEVIGKLKRGDALFVSVRSDNSIGSYSVAVKDKKAQDILDEYYYSNTTNGAMSGKSFSNQVFLGLQYYIVSGEIDRVVANGATMYDLYINSKDLNNVEGYESADVLRRYILDSSQNVVYYDEAKDKMWLGNYNQIEPGDKVCIAGFRKYYVSCVVYK